MDKEKQHIDTKFIDQSWQNMSELLDKEMPVRKRKRRFIWMWFLGLAAILTLGLTYHLYTNQNQPNIPETLTDKVEKVAETETPIINNSTTQKDKKNIISQKISKQAQIPHKVNKEKQNLETSKTIISKQVSSNNPIETKVLKEQQINPLLLENKKKGERLKDLPQASILPNKVEANFQKWLNHNIPVLPLPAFSLFHLERRIEILPIVIPVARKSQKWRFGLYAGGLTNKLGSFRAGLHSNLILSPEWTLHVGLGYARKNKNNVFSNIGNEYADIIEINDQENEDMEDQNPSLPLPPPPPNTDPIGAAGTAFNDPEEDLPSNLNYTNIHYFELPILFQYRFSPKWSIDFGGQIGYLHGVRYNIDGESNFTTDLAAFSNTNTRVQDSNSEIINDFNFAAIGGVSYKIVPKISAYSSYHFSNNYLTITPSNASLTKRWQQIEVGIRYYIK